MIQLAMHPIERYRKEHNLSLDELAVQLNSKLTKNKRKLNYVRLYQYIKGYRFPKPELAQVIAQSLGVPIEKILFPNGKRQKSGSHS